MRRDKDAIINKPSNATGKNSRSLFSLDAAHFKPLLDNHVATANYLISPSDAQKTPPSLSVDRTFHTNNNIWESINYERNRTEKHIILNSFFLFDWFPRAPGLFYTRRGREARLEAKHHFKITESGLLLSEERSKSSLLDGGIGNVRLHPIQVGETSFYLMSATSTGICHEGVPVAIPEHLYEQYQDQIATQGFVISTLIGRLRTIPERVVTLYHNRPEVPQFYLMVEEMRPAPYANCRNVTAPYVSAALSFVSETAGTEGIYAYCINFNPGDPNSLPEKVEWLQHSTQQGEYAGQVLTDFDERQSYFPEAPFSLQKVMGLNVDKTEASTTLEKLDIEGTGPLFNGMKKMKMLSLSVEEFVASKSQPQLSDTTE